ncbi:hypothetical protein [Streptomyces phaeofaciens]
MQQLVVEAPLVVLAEGTAQVLRGTQDDRVGDGVRTQAQLVGVQA